MQSPRALRRSVVVPVAILLAILASPAVVASAGGERVPSKSAKTSAQSTRRPSAMRPRRSGKVARYQVDRFKGNQRIARKVPTGLAGAKVMFFEFRQWGNESSLGQPARTDGGRFVVAQMAGGVRVTERIRGGKRKFEFNPAGTIVAIKIEKSGRSTWFRGRELRVYLRRIAGPGGDASAGVTVFRVSPGFNPRQAAYALAKAAQDGRQIAASSFNGDRFTASPGETGEQVLARLERDRL